MNQEETYTKEHQEETYTKDHTKNGKVNSPPMKGCNNTTSKLQNVNFRTL